MTPIRKLSQIKQKKQITRRLMELSLKIDDYVYKNKTIVPEDASLYIEEITMYKAQCNQDTRTLQVIEKLMRCMTRIVMEEGGHKPLTHHTSTGANSMTPVYSLPDEDNTFPQTIACGVKNVINQTEKGIDIFENIDLCSGTESIGTENVEVYLQKAISNLSLNETVDSLKATVDNDVSKENNNLINEGSKESNDMNIDVNKENENDGNSNVECSQSILNEFEFNQSNYHLDVVKIPIIKSVNKSIHDKPLIESENLKEIDSAKLVPTKTSTSDKNKIKIQNNLASNSNIINVKNRKIATNRKKRKTVKADKVNKNKKTNVKKRKGKTSTPTGDTITDQLTKAQKRLKIPMPIDRSQHTNKIYINSNTSTRKGRTSNKSIVPIYKESLINDLSWIENIRFVREITEDEYDLTLHGLDDCFWDNYTLPPNWDDQDFVYN